MRISRPDLAMAMAAPRVQLAPRPADDAGTDDAPDAVALALAAHVKAAVAAEVQRLASLGERVVALPVANVGIVVEEARGGRVCVNRVELSSSFDAAVVTGLMLSPPVAVPPHLVEADRGALALHFVVLQTPSPVRLLAGVVVEPGAHPDNDLSTWRFVNNRAAASTHVITY